MYIKCFHVFKDVTFLKKKLVRGKICKGDEPVITTLKDVSFLNLFKPKGNESVFTT